MVPGVVYLLGPGTTTRAVAEALGVGKTLLGVDAVRDRRLIASDLSERHILELVEAAADASLCVVVTVIGGQGHIFGRGNQQLSAEVIGRVGLAHVLVVASETKLLSLHGGPLLVDSGDSALDARFTGYLQVVTGLGRRTIYRVAGV